MPEERLAGAYLYYDAAADDARLTLTLARTAALDHGAVVANHAGVVALLHEERPGRRCGGRRRRTASSRCEPGPWSTQRACGATTCARSTRAATPTAIRPAKGIHITVPWEKVRNDIAVVVPVPKDKRSVFVVPWLPTDDGGFELTYIGTTDTDYDGPIDDPQCTADDVAYLLRAINLSVREPLTEADVVGTWAGLRPLVKAASQRPHRRPVAAPQGDALARRGDHGHRRASSPPTGRWPRTPSTRWCRHLDGLGRRPAAAAPRELRLRGAQAVDPDATGRAPAPRRSVRQRGPRCSTR